VQSGWHKPSTGSSGLKGQGTREWRVEGVLERKVRQWKEEARVEQEAEEKRGTRWADNGSRHGDIPDDEDDTAEVKALKVWCLLCPC